VRHKDVRCAEEMARGYSDAGNWRVLPDSRRGLYVLELTKPGAIVPEHLWIELRFPDGTAVESPVEITDPNFDLRDGRSGIPLGPGLDAILGRGKPIVTRSPGEPRLRRWEGKRTRRRSTDRSKAGSPWPTTLTTTGSQKPFVLPARSRKRGDPEQLSPMSRHCGCAQGPSSGRDSIGKSAYSYKRGPCAREDRGAMSRGGPVPIRPRWVGGRVADSQNRTAKCVWKWLRRHGSFLIADPVGRGSPMSR